MCLLVCSDVSTDSAAMATAHSLATHRALGRTYPGRQSSQQLRRNMANGPDGVVALQCVRCPDYPSACRRPNEYSMDATWIELRCIDRARLQCVVDARKFARPVGKLQSIRTRREFPPVRAASDRMCPAGSTLHRYRAPDIFLPGRTRVNPPDSTELRHEPELVHRENREVTCQETPAHQRAAARVV